MISLRGGFIISQNKSKLRICSCQDFRLFGDIRGYFRWLIIFESRRELNFVSIYFRKPVTKFPVNFLTTWLESCFTIWGYLNSLKLADNDNGLPSNLMYYFKIYSPQSKNKLLFWGFRIKKGSFSFRSSNIFISNISIWCKQIKSINMI